MRSAPNSSAAQNSAAAPKGALRELKGVGPKLEQQLVAEGFTSFRALATLRPRRFRDWRTPTPIAELPAMLLRPDPDDPTPEVILVGTVRTVNQFHGRISIQRAEFDDDTGTCDLVWFGRGGPRIALNAGARLLVHGRPKLIRSRGALKIEINVLAHRALVTDEPYVGRLWPVYPATKDLSSRVIANVIAKNLEVLLKEIGDDPLPPHIVHRHGFLTPRDSWRELHAPTSFERIELAQSRLSFDVFFAIAFAAAYRKKLRQRVGRALPMKAPPGLMERFEADLPFVPTGAQRRVIQELWGDLASETAMNRLLQGDVGSGKTLVAAACIVLAAQAGAQSALMAPTELLARQHARKLGPLLAPFGIGVEFIAATQGAKARREAEERLAAGAIAVAVGTHALLTERVSFQRLGLAIIDEQHRFGVMQRATLRAKGESVHTLAMTATPIPRTLAQIRYADLDISIIDELPPGRKPVKTYVRDETARNRIYDFIRKEVRAGRQAYVVAPVIEEGESTLNSALAEAELLQTKIFPDLRVGLVHGRLPPKERDATMERFSAGEIDVLIATTVIEVGVDVPNAAIMVVLDAHRFGLAQLHQLRGRVGRGSASATCILVAPKKTARLDILTRTTDGFEIADADLEFRGEGEFSGTLQSGNGQVLLRGRDEIAVYLSAREDAEAILEYDPEVSMPEHRQLLRLIDESHDAVVMRVTS
jgi:ATP-dependent DNA helicase RecG